MDAWVQTEMVQEVCVAGVVWLVVQKCFLFGDEFGVCLFVVYTTLSSSFLFRERQRERRECYIW